MIQAVEEPRTLPREQPLSDLGCALGLGFLVILGVVLTVTLARAAL